MADIILFPRREEPAEDELDIDLLTAVAVAIRDLRDIGQQWGEEPARRQAEECRQMLERAFAAAAI